MRRVAVAVLVVIPAVVTAGTAAAAGPRQRAVRPHDLTILAPREVSLSGPPYISPLGTVTYGEQVTLTRVRDHATAVSPQAPGKPIDPGRGFRWVGLRLRETNTGSQAAVPSLPLVTGSDGRHYGGMDWTMPGCGQLATFPPRTLAPGRSVTACDTYLMPGKVTVRAVTINLGGWQNPAASGLWQIIAGPLPAPRFPLSYAALGDSYSSGEGSGDYETACPPAIAARMPGPGWSPGRAGAWSA